jgi:hypothetical protein
MMMSMRLRLLIATGVGIAAIGAGIGTGTAQADTVATNDGASQITATTAVLNGTVDTNVADSAWYFRYGPTTSYGTYTKVSVIGAVNDRVSIQITGLQPSTTYHFQLVVGEGSYPIQYHLSDDGTFTTAAAPPPPAGRSGRATLRSHRLKLHRGAVWVPYRCAGPSGAVCAGEIKISARGRIGKRIRTVGCGLGELNSETAGRIIVVTRRVSAGCRSLLKHARHHRLGAALRARYSTGQPSLKTRVTLTG